MNMFNCLRCNAIFLLLLIAMLALPALAHEQGAITGGGLLSGFSHPFGGLDHILAMFAVGLWGAFLGMPAVWMLPVAFPALMAVGGILGIAGVPFPPVELGISLSVLVLGAVIALAWRAPLWASLVLVSFFALFHGYAHGLELPDQQQALPYSLGFIIATGLIHLAGIAFGLLTRWQFGRPIIRVGGAAIAVAGGWLLAGTL